MNELIIFLSFKPLIHLVHTFRIAAGYIHRYARKYIDELLKWINEWHMFTRGHAKHPCVQN
jgi:hypothetical protein